MDGTSAAAAAAAVVAAVVVQFGKAPATTAASRLAF
jgi:hypothetical protein